jgi:hypothetical protein
MSHIPERSVARPRISIVVPALNEARNLEVVLPELPPVYEVILVDGTSTDGTVETALRVLPTVKIVKQTRRGKGNALVCGFEAASGDVVVMFDADGSADPAEIHRFVEALRDGADFAKGSRALEAGGSQDITVLRSWGNRVMTSITNLLFRTGYTDLCYGYNTFWRDVLGLLDLPSPTAGTRVWGTASRSRPHIRREQPPRGPRRVACPQDHRHGALGLPLPGSSACPGGAPAHCCGLHVLGRGAGHFPGQSDPMDRSGRRPGRDGPAQDARRAGGRERDPSGRCPDAAGASVLTNVDGIMRRRSASPWWDL